MSGSILDYASTLYQAQLEYRRGNIDELPAVPPLQETRQILGGSAGRDLGYGDVLECIRAMTGQLADSIHRPGRI